MSWWNFGFKGTTSGAGSEGNELPEIYPLAVRCDAFVVADIRATYIKILTDVAERTHGLEDEQWAHLWDSCVQSQSSDGLITMLADTMIAMGDLYLVWRPSVDILRKADANEARQIEADYKKDGSSKLGVFISFRNYRKTDMLRIYSAMEYCVLASLHKTVNIAKAVQVKMSEMRSSVSLTDGAVAIAQAQSIASALRAGLDVLIDKDDEITTATPNVDPTEKAIMFLDAKRAFYLGLPLAYISGLQTGGIGASGDADARAIDRGLRPYFASIMQPVLEAIFDIDVSYIPEDTRALDSGMEVLKTFDLVSDTYISAETKRLIAARAFDVDPQAEFERLQKEAGNRGTDSTLNGAQAGAMANFIKELATGSIAPDSAVKYLMVTFQVSEEDAKGIVEPMRDFIESKQRAATKLVPAAASSGGAA